MLGTYIEPRDDDMAPKKVGPRDSYLQPGREGKVSVIAWIDPERRRALKQLALDLDRTQQDLIDEALADLIAKHRMGELP